MRALGIALVRQRGLEREHAAARQIDHFLGREVHLDLAADGLHSSATAISPSRPAAARSCLWAGPFRFSGQKMRSPAPFDIEASGGPTARRSRRKARATPAC